MLQNSSRYKIRPGPPGTVLKRAPTGKSLSPVLTRELLKNYVAESPISVGNNSPCQNDAVETGMGRAFTFDVEEGALGWNLLENNLRQDPIPPEPLALNEARLLCREAMTLITEEVSELLVQGCKTMF